jgi:hypothetical protein
MAFLNETTSLHPLQTVSIVAALLVLHILVPWLMQRHNGIPQFPADFISASRPTLDSFHCDCYSGRLGLLLYRHANGQTDGWKLILKSSILIS